MNKKLIAIAIAGAFVGASPAVMAGAAVDVGVSGFVDSIFTIDNEEFDNTATDGDGVPNNANPANQNLVTDGEIDFMGSANNVNVRIDLDVFENTTNVEQAVISWMANDALTVNIGQQNHNITFEGQDAPDLFQTSFGQIAGIIRGQTSTAGSVDGVVLDFNAGPAMINIGLLNDIGGVAEENSLMLRASGSPMEGLNLEFGMITQADLVAGVNTGQLETITDINGTYGMDNWWVALEFATFGADGGAESAYGLTGHMDFGNGFGATLRYDSVAYDVTGRDDSTSTTVAGTYAAADNLGFVLEYRNDESGITGVNDTSAITIEAVGTFGK